MSPKTERTLQTDATFHMAPEPKFPKSQQEKTLCVRWGEVLTTETLSTTFRPQPAAIQLTALT